MVSVAIYEEDLVSFAYVICVADHARIFSVPTSACCKAISFSRIHPPRPIE